MTREKINDYIAEMQDQSGDYILRNWQRNAIADYCIEHQTDLLKEFVEWEKKALKWYERGLLDYQKNIVADIIDELDKDLEKFLEEHNGKQD